MNPCRKHVGINRNTCCRLPASNKHAVELIKDKEHPQGDVALVESLYNGIDKRYNRITHVPWVFSSETPEMGQVANDESTVVSVCVRGSDSVCMLEGLLVAATRVSGADANEQSGAV